MKTIEKTGTIGSVFDTEPDFVNEIGVKWWRDTYTTQYAQKKDSQGTSLDAVCYYVEEVSGKRTRLLVHRSGTILADDQSLEGIGIKIDILKMLQRDTDNQQTAMGHLDYETH